MFLFSDITQAAKFSAMIPSSILINDLPPAFSRLPPDGHEFPPNYMEPIVLSRSENKLQKGPTIKSVTKSDNNKMTDE